MRFVPALVAASSLAVSLATAQDALACGGCFHGEPSPMMQTRPTQVTGHRMALAVSQTQTTLWDQIQYVGEPSEFAWVLPIRGQVEVDTSSDLLFEVLESKTNVVLRSPAYTCPGPPNCNSGFGGNGTGATKAASTGFGAATATASGPPPVEVYAHEVVGPYETVQLGSDDPTALATWLSDHGFVVPPDIEPLIAAYVDEGFDFLAMRLVPGQGVQSMKPVRITTPGAGLGLPLRMVAAGTGARVPLQLWILAEARYEPQNMESFVIPSDDLIWSFDTGSSNYTTLRDEGFAARGYAAWLTSHALPTNETTPFALLTERAVSSPADSGYGEIAGTGALEKATADVDHLLDGIPSGGLFITALYADLARTALDRDLTLTASLTGDVESDIQIFRRTGTPPCPSYSPCPNGNGNGNGNGNAAGGLSGLFEETGSGGDAGGRVAGGGCTVTSRSESRAALALGALLAVGAIARRRRRDASRRSHDIS